MHLITIVSMLVCVPGAVCHASVEPELTDAVRAKNLRQVERLLAQGANVNARDEGEEQTPLMWAAQSGDPALIHLLLAHGGAVNLRDDSGNTALMLAAAKGDTRSASLLLAAGSTLYARNNAGATALTLAAAAGHASLAVQLRRIAAREAQDIAEQPTRPGTLRLHRSPR